MPGVPAVESSPNPGCLTSGGAGVDHGKVDGHRFSQAAGAGVGQPDDRGAGPNGNDVGLVRTSGATGPLVGDDDVSGADGAVRQGELDGRAGGQCSAVGGDDTALGVQGHRSGLAGALGDRAKANGAKADRRGTSDRVVGGSGDEEPRGDVVGIRHGY